MAITVTLDGDAEAAIGALVEDGGFADARSAVDYSLRVATQLRSAKAAFETAIARSEAEFDAGECVDLDEAFDWLEARYARPA